jgi:uncharacterized BrkB/YihY/UPF0761 family membrane protein
MSDHDTHSDDNPFHLPAPSALPIIVGFGIALTLFGFVPDSRLWRLSMVAIGATITLGAILSWVRDSIAEYNSLDD